MDGDNGLIRMMDQLFKLFKKAIGLVDFIFGLVDNFLDRLEEGLGILMGGLQDFIELEEGIGE